MNTKRATLAERFWPKVAKGGGDACHLWSGCTNNKGYGQIGRGGRYGRMMLAHRAAWEIANGPIPKGLCVLHKCDTPLCVNPAHLFLGTIADNNADMLGKGRASGGGLKGEDHGGSKLTSAQVLEIRATVGVSQRKLCSKYGIGRSHIHRIISRECWSHLTEQQGVAS